MQKIGDIPNTRADSNGEFTDGNVAGGVPPTILPAAWFNTIQRELMSVLSAVEIDADSAQFNQVLLSIQKLIGEGIPDIKDASLTQKGIVQLSNATNSTSEVLAATPKAVRAVDIAALKIANNLSEIKDAGPTAVAQTLLNLGLNDVAKMTDVTGLIDAVFPIGVPIPYPLSDIPTPNLGIVWFKMNGGSFNPITYPKLANKYPSGVLPDVRGDVIRAWDDGRGIDPARALLTEQKGSYLLREWTANNVVNFYSGDGVGLEEDPIIGAIPALDAKLVTAGGTFRTSSNHLGIARMRNISYNYIVRAS